MASFHESQAFIMNLFLKFIIPSLVGEAATQWT
jgi:hypothetical protein